MRNLIDYVQYSRVKVVALSGTMVFHFMRWIYVLCAAWVYGYVFFVWRAFIVQKSSGTYGADNLSMIGALSDCWSYERPMYTDCALKVTRYISWHGKSLRSRQIVSDLLHSYDSSFLDRVKGAQVWFLDKFTLRLIFITINLTFSHNKTLKSCPSALFRPSCA